MKSYLRDKISYSNVNILKAYWKNRAVPQETDFFTFCYLSNPVVNK